jgi:O-glycosyl hydrolase
LLPNGQVLVAGGDGSSGVTNSAELYNPATGTWTATNSLTTARYAHTATLLPNGQVLVAGGEDSNGNSISSAELYNPASGTWTATGPLNTARFVHTATLLPNGQVLVAGGDGSSGVTNSAELYNPATGTWTATNSLTTARCSHTATLLPNGKVLVAGGDGSSGILSSAELYNPATGTWTATGPLNTARYVHTATLLPNGRVLVAGGYGSSGILSSAELYNPASGMWTATGPLNTARFVHTATLLPNGQVLVAGGYGSSGALSSAELYNPATGTWTATGPLNTARYGHTATLLPNGQVLVAGGYGSSGALSSAELYNPATGTWTATGPLNTARYGHTATLLPNGKVLVAGGYGSSGILSSAELYNPATGTWTATGPLNTARYGHMATLLPNDRVLVAGGNGSSGVTNSAELYDPATGTWTATGPLNTARYYHTATLLPNGKVLVAGGYGSSGVLSSAELYNVGLGFNASWQPQIATVNSPLSPSSSVMLTGSQFRGISEGSGGNGCQDSPADYPVVQLRRLDNEQTLFLLTTNWSTNSFTSAPGWNLPPGYALVTVFVNGIPSPSSILIISSSALGLASSVNPSPYGGGVTFTATVQTNGAIAGDATGQVVFASASGPFSTNAMSGGSATSASITNLPVGTDLITAIYSGGNYPGGTNTLNQVVNALVFAQGTVDWNTVYQRIDGFGASSAWQSSFSTAQYDMFFSTNTGIGLSLLRNHIVYAGSTSSNATPSTGEISIMQQAQARGATVWSTPWTPAAGFKSTNDIYDGDQATDGGLDGGSYLGAGNNITNLNYASQLANYVYSMSNSYGVNIYAISVQNEPDADVTTYEACQWTGGQIRDFVTNLYAALVAKGVGSTKIIIPESEHWSSDTALFTPTLNNPAAAADVSIIANHNYDGMNFETGDTTIPAALSVNGKALWETEVSTGDSYDGSIGNGLYWGQRIYLFLTAAQANAWHYWWLISQNPDNEGLTDTSGNPAKRMYVLGQYSRFVRPGYYRIGASTTGNALISAFNDANTGNFVIVALNNTSSDIIQTFNLTNFPGGVSLATPWITSATLSLSNQTPVTVSSSSFSYILPAMSAVTFVGQVTAITPTPPTLAPAPNQTINAGQTLLATNAATDPNVPPQTLTFTLLSTPSGATLTSLNATNALFTWRAPVSQANTTNLVTVVVTDNGTSLSATNSFNVIVNPLSSLPSVSSISSAGGQLTLVVNGPQDLDYTVLTSTNLTTPPANWQVLLMTNSPVTPVTLVVPMTTGPGRFYRIQIGP